MLRRRCRFRDDSCRRSCRCSCRCNCRCSRSRRRRVRRLLLLSTSRVSRLSHMSRTLLRHNYIVQTVRPLSNRLTRVAAVGSKRRHDSGYTGTPAKGHLRMRTRTDIILSSLCSPPPATAATPRRPHRTRRRARVPVPPSWVSLLPRDLPLTLPLCSTTGLTILFYRSHDREM